MFIKQTEHIHTCIKFQLMGQLWSWWWGLRAAEPPGCGRFLIRPEAYSAGYSAGVAENLDFWMITGHYPRWQRIAGYYVYIYIYFIIFYLYLQRCIHLNTALDPPSAWWGEYSTRRLLTVAVPFLPAGVKTTWPYDLSSVLVSAACRMTWHDLDQFPPGQGRLGPAGSTTVLNAFGPGLSPVWSDVQWCVPVHFGQGCSQYRTFWVDSAWCTACL